jgi:hypothetical protein
VGHWEDSIATNRASAAAARKAKSPGEVLHALDYQVYAYLQTAQDTAAAVVVDELAAIVREIDTAEQYGQAGYYAAATIPARYSLERGDYRAAAALDVRTTPFAFIDAITHFARAIGAARSGNPAAAAVDVDRLTALREALLASKDAYWAQQVEIQLLAARAWVAAARGSDAEALALMTQAADIEDSTDKSAISPGPLAPAREMLGELLLQLQRPTDALTELEAVMRKEPNRFRALYLGAQAASRTHQPEKASTYYRQIVEMCAKGDPARRAELAEARKQVGK